VSPHYVKTSFSDRIDSVMSALLGFSKNCQNCQFSAIFSNFLHNWSSDLHEILCVGVLPHYPKISFSDWIDSVRSALLGFSENCQKCWFLAVFSNFLHNWSVNISRTVCLIGLCKVSNERSWQAGFSHAKIIGIICPPGGENWYQKNNLTVFWDFCT